MNIGYDKPLYIQPFDHRGSFQTKMFGWKGVLTEEQTAQIAAAKQVIYDGFKAAPPAGVPAQHVYIGCAIATPGRTSPPTATPPPPPQTPIRLPAFGESSSVHVRATRTS